MNGPFTPDLANPISKIGDNAKKNDWPLEVKVGKLDNDPDVSSTLFVIGF